jgi:hypothetical protein
MRKRSVQLDEDVYELLVAHNRDGEPISDTHSRLISDVSLLDLADEDEEYDEKRTAKQKDALDRTARTDATAAKNVAENVTEKDS